MLKCYWKNGFTSRFHKRVKKCISRKFLSLVFISLTFTQLSYADDTRQIHARFGAVYASYDGVVSGDLENYNMIDLEYETFLSSNKSYYFRVSEAFDATKTIFTYSYVGGGMKYYFASKGNYYEGGDGADTIISAPKWRFYYGWEIGIAHVVLQTIGEFLQINTTSYDYGGALGTIYNITDRLGLEFNFTTQFSTGFTSISTGAVVLKGTVGVTYFL